MSYPDFVTFYREEHPVLTGCLRRNKAPDPVGVADEAFARAWAFGSDRAEAWTRNYVFQIARGILSREERRYGKAIAQLDEEFDVEDPRVEALFADDGRLTARYQKMRSVIADLPTPQRIALVVPDLYFQPMEVAAQVLNRSVDTVNRRRREAKRVLGDAHLGAGDEGVATTLYLLDLPDDRHRDPARRKETTFSLGCRPTQPSLDAKGQVELALQGPATLPEPIACHAIVHALVDDAGSQTIAVSQATEVEWIAAKGREWSARLAPRFAHSVGEADLVAIFLFEGDWIAGRD